MKKKTILALGADIKNRFLVAKGRKLFSGPDVSDLGVAENYALFKRAIEKALKRVKPDLIACDMHPGYFSTLFAKKYFRGQVPGAFFSVQHHHAHIGSVMYEYKLKGPVIGVSFDGTGYGADGNIWGGEFLIVNGRDAVRQAHLNYRMMPGGDKVISEPWRMVLSILGPEGGAFLRKTGQKEKDVVLAMMSAGINSPLTSSAGRLFDAAAALLGVCAYASYEAEGPVKLESMCEKTAHSGYAFRTLKGAGCDVVDTDGLFLGIAADIRKSVRKSIVASKFHNSMAEIVVRTVKKISKRSGIKTIALSGGVFRNKFLTVKIMKKLEHSGFKVFINGSVPVDDLNIALGQYYVARLGVKKKKEVLQCV